MTLKAFLLSLAYAAASAAISFAVAHVSGVTGVNSAYTTLAATLLAILGHWLPTPSTVAPVTTSVVK